MRLKVGMIFFVVSRDDDGRAVLPGHLVVDAHDRQRARCRAAQLARQPESPVAYWPTRGQSSHAVARRPKNSDGCALARCPTSSASSNPIARARDSPFACPASIGSSAMLSVTSRNGIRYGAWNTKPMLSRRSARRSRIFQPSYIVAPPLSRHRHRVNHRRKSDCAWPGWSLQRPPLASCQSLLARRRPSPTRLRLCASHRS